MDRNEGLAHAPLVFTIGFFNNKCCQKNLNWRNLAYITNLNIIQGEFSTYLTDDKQREHHKVLDDSLRGLSVISLSQGGIQNNYAV